MPNQFFTEGNDIKFIQDILKSRIKFHETDKFVATEGWTKLHLVSSRFLENTNKGGRNFVFFDADDDIEERRIALTTTAQELGITFELFLFPNDLDAGIVESLLLQIVLPQYNPIFDCFTNYSTCISNAHPAYILPDLKSKFFAFTESTGQKTNLKNINFRDNTYYNLNHNSLNPLYNFINGYL